MPQSYRLLAVDIDGTLTRPDGSVSARTVRVIQALQKRGMHLCIASGRPPQGIMPVARMMGMDDYGGYIIGFNGGLVMDYASGKVIYTASLPDEALPVVLECGRRPGHAVFTYADGYICTESPDDPYVRISHQRNGMPVRAVSDFIAQIPLPVPKCIISGDPGTIPAMQREVLDRLRGVADAYISDPYFLEVVRQGVDKADALSRLMERLGVTCHQLVAAGDGHNDIGMIRLASMGIAMGNAHPDVRSVADVVAPSAAQDGLAQVLEGLLDRI